MKSRQEIEQELQDLLELQKRLENAPQQNLYKLALLTMRIDAIKWVLDLPGEDE